jgi:hypothetical protein
VAQEVDHLPSKYEALSLNPSTTKKKKKVVQAHKSCPSTVPAPKSLLRPISGEQREDGACTMFPVFPPLTAQPHLSVSAVEEEVPC